MGWLLKKWLGSQGNITPAGAEGGKFTPKLKLEPHRTIYEGSTFRAINRGLAWLHRIREQLGVDTKFQRLDHPLDVVKGCYRKGGEAINWKGQSLAVLKTSENYLNLKMIPLVDAETITKILKPEFETARVALTLMKSLRVMKATC